MTTQTEAIRLYLLGELKDNRQRTEIEERILLDTDFLEEISILEEELIEDYLEGVLSQRDKEAFESFFMSLPGYDRKLDFARMLRRHLEKEDKQPTTSLRKDSTFGPRLVPLRFSEIGLAVAAAVLLIAGVLLWRTFLLPNDLVKGLAALRGSYGTMRPLEARISGFSYAPVIVLRGREDKTDYLARDRAERLLLDAVSEHPGDESHDALGEFYLASRSFDKAIDQFESALKENQNSARAESDLGAALLEYGHQQILSNHQGEGLESLAQSLEHINKALQIAPGMLEPLFNKALCLQLMLAKEQAREAWNDYLRHDSTSGWAKEAQRNLELLSQSSAAQSTPDEVLKRFVEAFQARDNERAWEVLSHNREIVTGKLIPQQLEGKFVDLRIGGHEKEAREVLALFSFAGELETQKGGDSYTAELSHLYAEASPSRLQILAKAIEHRHDAYGFCLLGRYEAAKTSFEMAREEFHEAQDTLEAKQSVYWAGYCLIQLDHISDSISLLQSVAEFSRKHDYKWLLAQSYYWLGIAHSILDDYSNAIEYLNKSLTLAQTISDIYQQQKTLDDLASEYADLQQTPPSLKFLYRSVDLAQADAGPRLIWATYSGDAMDLFRLGYYDAAAVYAEEALAPRVREAIDASMSCVVHLDLAQIYSKMQRFPEAMAQTSQAMKLARSVEDRDAMKRFTAEAFLQHANVLRLAGKCPEAAQYYNRSIEVYENLEFDLGRYSAYQGRLLCSLDQPDQGAVETDLSFLLNISERDRKRIREEKSRNTFFDEQESLYDIAIDYEHRRGEDKKALDLSEAGRSRSLLDALLSKGNLAATTNGQDLVFSGASRPLDVEYIRRNLPAKLQVVVYAVLPAKLLIWSLTRDSFEVVERTITREALEKRVLEYLRALKQSDDQSSSLSKLGEELDTILLGALSETLHKTEQICIVPDKTLCYLPFGSLISLQTGKYFIEDRPIFYAPSLNVLWRASKEARERAGLRKESILSVGYGGSNAFDSELPPLPDAAREARQIAGLFARATCLTGARATKQGTLNALSSADVIHIAAHYVINQTDPLRSRLLLASHDDPDAEATNSSSLFAYEILRKRLTRSRLVVLSACQTGIDRYYNGEGAVGLANVFMSAGVPLVVASDWAVDSRATSLLMTAFYCNRTSGFSTVEALRQAQIAMLHGSDESYRAPYYWAAFLPIGGFAQF